MSDFHVYAISSTVFQSQWHLGFHDRYPLLILSTTVGSDLLHADGRTEDVSHPELESVCLDVGLGGEEADEGF